MLFRWKGGTKKQKKIVGGEMRVYCDYCDKTLSKSTREIERYKHHFCDRRCYHKFRKNKSKTGKSKDMRAQHKIKLLAKKLASIKVENGQRA